MFRNALSTSSFFLFPYSSILVLWLILTNLLFYDFIMWNDFSTKLFNSLLLINMSNIIILFFHLPYLQHVLSFIIRLFAMSYTHPFCYFLEGSLTEESLLWIRVSESCTLYWYVFITNWLFFILLGLIIISFFNFSAERLLLLKITH